MMNRILYGVLYEMSFCQWVFETVVGYLLQGQWRKAWAIARLWRIVFFATLEQLECCHVAIEETLRKRERGE